MFAFERKIRNRTGRQIGLSQFVDRIGCLVDIGRLRSISLCQCNHEMVIKRDRHRVFAWLTDVIAWSRISVGRLWSTDKVSYGKVSGRLHNKLGVTISLCSS